MENTELTFQDEALNVVAKKAIDRRTGARGLRSIMEGILLDTMFDLPGLDGVEQVVIGPDVVEGKSRPLYIYAERNEKRHERLSLRAPSQSDVVLRAAGGKYITQILMMRRQCRHLGGNMRMRRDSAIA